MLFDLNKLVIFSIHKRGSFLFHD